MRKLYKVDDSYTGAQARLIVGVRYELDGRSSYTFAEDVSTELLGRITDGKYRGVTIKTAAARVYNTKLAAHILGTVGAIWQEEWRSDESTGYVGYADKGYNMNDLVGKDGVEKAFEEYLHGNDGKRLITTDENGKITGELYTREPQPGGTVALTIDIDLQQVVEDTLASTIQGMIDKDSNERGGAAAVIQVGTGEVLAMASYPTYDLETFNQDYDELVKDERLPMFNRATQGVYAPRAPPSSCARPWRRWRRASSPPARSLRTRVSTPTMWTRSPCAGSGGRPTPPTGASTSVRPSWTPATTSTTR